MKMRYTMVAGLCAAALSGNVLAKNQAEIVASEMATISKHLALRPQTAIDLRGVSGEFCFNMDISRGGHMTHYATDPTRTQEDVIDFVNAKSMQELGVDLKKFPPFPGKLGSMEPGTWYYLAQGTFEPHHGRKFGFPLLMRATNIE